MRTLMLRLAVLAGVVLMLGACGDSPTQSDQQWAPDLAAPTQDELLPQGCVSDGLCVLPPISGGWCEPWMELDWDCDETGGECMTSVGDPTDPEWATTVQGCPGGDGSGGGGGGYTPPPGGDPGTICPEFTDSCPEEPDECEWECPDEQYSDVCPQPILGKVATVLVPIAGRNHEFKFEGPFYRVNPLVGRSPAWYEIPRPTLSKDDWWMAESGRIQLVCWGRYQIVLRTRTWVGTMYVQSTDLHVVMAPGHPDF